VRQNTHLGEKSEKMRGVGKKKKGEHKGGKREFYLGPGRASFPLLTRVKAMTSLQETVRRGRFRGPQKFKEHRNQGFIKTRNFSEATGRARTQWRSLAARGDIGNRSGSVQNKINEVGLKGGENGDNHGIQWCETLPRGQTIGGGRKHK